MANKTIPDLTELTSFEDATVVPADSGIQTFKVKSSTIRRRCLGDAVIGSAAGCTHTTLALALADSAVTNGMEIVLTASFSLTSTLTISKSVKIRGLPGVTITKGAPATTGLSLDATGITIEGLRFAGYTAGGNVAVSLLATATYCRVRNNNFAAGTDTEVYDALVPAGKKPSVIGNITEV